MFARLSSDGQTEDIVRELARDPVIKADALAARSALERRQRPCGQEGIALLVMPLAALYAMPDRSESEWVTFWRLYIDALGDLPFEALDYAVKEYVKQGEFFPKPAALFKIAEPIAIKLRVAAWRAKRITEYQPAIAHRISDEERQRVREMLAEFKMKPIQTARNRETPHEMAERLRKMA